MLVKVLIWKCFGKGTNGIECTITDRVKGNPLMGYLIAICMINAPVISFITTYFYTNVYEMWHLSLKCTMADVRDDFANLSLDEIAGNRLELLGKIQKQIRVAISSLEAWSDLVTNEQVRRILHQVNKNIDLIKASCNEQGIHVYNFIVIFPFYVSGSKTIVSYFARFPLRSYKVVWGLFNRFREKLLHQKDKSTV